MGHRQATTGGIYLRGNRYYIDYRTPEGKRIRRSGGSSREEAEAELRKVQLPASGTFDALVVDYLRYLKVHCKARTLDTSTVCSRRLLGSFAGREASSLTVRDVEDYIMRRKEEGVKPKTINGELIVLRAVLKRAQRLGSLSSTPDIKLLKVPRKKHIRILSREDIQHLAEVAREPYRGIILVAAATGFRANEILHLQWKDIGFDTGMVSVTGKEGWTAKSYEERVVYVGEETLHHLKKHREKSSFPADTGWVFCTRDGKTLELHNLCRGIRQVFKKAGLYEVGAPLLHRIRHSYVSTLLANGVDVETVRSLSGHSNLSTVQLYAHSVTATKKAAASKGLL